MLRALVYIVPIAMAIYALVDLVQFREETPLGLPKGVWALVIIFLPVIGSIGWIVISRMTGPPRSRRNRRPEPPVAPDDNVEFLRYLEQEQRRKAREERGKKPRQSEGDNTDGSSG